MQELSDGRRRESARSQTVCATRAAERPRPSARPARKSPQIPHRHSTTHAQGKAHTGTEGASGEPEVRGGRIARGHRSSVQRRGPTAEVRTVRAECVHGERPRAQLRGVHLNEAEAVDARNARPGVDVPAVGPHLRGTLPRAWGAALRLRLRGAARSRRDRRRAPPPQG